MTEIRRDEAVPARARVRWLRPAIAAAAVATVTAITLVVLPSGNDTTAQPPSRATVALLEDLALAAEHEPSYGPIRDDQFVYVDSKVSYSSSEGGETTIQPLHRLESWHSVDGTRKGLMRETGRGDWPMDPDAQPGELGYEVTTNYKHLSTLPTDTGKMYDWLRRVAPEYSGQETNQAMFVLVGDLVQSAIVPPEQRAAL
ncbi:CU044_5270 family protein, partial [Streptomyces sp. KR55]|uniref:CU044_5270 family protein n=1 Tax=Streptomyces sp. KR55 TaxID=3457425 RepID=UPI003FD18811